MCPEKISKVAHSKKKKKKRRDFWKISWCKIKAVDINYSSVKGELYIVEGKKWRGCVKKYNELEKEMGSKLLICS